jgi:isorenieratene synthase
MTERTRSMLFEAFARSFFCNQGELSAAELVAMFHYYFLGNPEGIGFDVTDTDYARRSDPLREYLVRHGGDVRTGTRVRSVGPDGQGWRVGTDSGGHHKPPRRPGVGPGALRALLAASPATAAAAPADGGRCESLTVAPPFAVSRLWLDRDVAPDRAPFGAVTGSQPRLGRGVLTARGTSAKWAARRRVGDRIALLLLRSRHRGGSRRKRCARSWPRCGPRPPTRPFVHSHDLIGGHRPRLPARLGRQPPQVRTDARGLRIAGDFVELPYLSG